MTQQQFKVPSGRANTQQLNLTANELALKNRKKQPYAKPWQKVKNNTAIGLLPRIVSKRMGESIESVENRD